MISTLLTATLVGGSLLTLLLAIYLFFRIKSEFSKLETQLLASKLKLQASIKEQIKGGVEFHFRNLRKNKPYQSIKSLKKIIK